MDEVEIRQAANLLRQQYGADAALIAARRADALLAMGSQNGYLAWIKIFQAITDLNNRADHNVARPFITQNRMHLLTGVSRAPTRIVPRRAR